MVSHQALSQQLPREALGLGSLRQAEAGWGQATGGWGVKSGFMAVGAQGLVLSALVLEQLFLIF